MRAKAHVLYRMFDIDDRLLYVGLTNNPKSRFGNHRDDKPWWNLVSTIKVQSYSDRDELVAAERTAIETEKPLYNVIHNKDVVRPVSDDDDLDDDDFDEDEYDEEEELHDKAMGMALHRLCAEQDLGVKRSGKQTAAMYLQYLNEALTMFRDQRDFEMVANQ